MATDREAREIASAARGEIDPDLLTATGTRWGFRTGYFHDAPLIHRLEPDETLQYVVENTGKGLATTDTVDERLQPDGDYRTAALITDRRTLFVIGQEGGDLERSVPHAEVLEASGSTAILSSKLVLRTRDADYRMYLSRSGEVADIADYVSAQAGAARDDTQRNGSSGDGAVEEPATPAESTGEQSTGKTRSAKQPPEDETTAATDEHQATVEEVRELLQDDPPRGEMIRAHNVLCRVVDDLDADGRNDLGESPEDLLTELEAELDDTGSPPDQEDEETTQTPEPSGDGETHQSREDQPVDEQLGWVEAVRRELARYRDRRDEAVVELQELYAFSEQRLSDRFPDNDNVRAKIRQTLQRLRDREEVESLDERGAYRIGELDVDTSDGNGSGSPAPDEQFAELTDFQRDILVIVAGMEQPKGLAVKEELDEYYEEEINHGRLYPNLDSLVEEGMIEKRALDDRSNAYTITDAGEGHLKRRRAWEDTQLAGGTATDGREADSDSSADAQSGDGDSTPEGSGGSVGGDPTRADLVAEIRDLEGELEKLVRPEDLEEHGSYEFEAYQREFRSWDEVLEEASVDKGEWLLRDLDRLWREHGEKPTISMVKRDGRYSAGAYAKEFGSWNGAVRKAAERRDGVREDTGGEASSSEESAPDGSEPSDASGRDSSAGPSEAIRNAVTFIGDISEDGRLDDPIVVECVADEGGKGSRKTAVLQVADLEGETCKLTIWTKHQVETDWTTGHMYLLENARGKVWPEEGTISRQLSSTKDLVVTDLGSSITDDEVLEILADESSEDDDGTGGLVTDILDDMDL